MATALQTILADAKNGRFSAVKTSMSDDDVVNVWDNVSSFIEKQMLLGKGVLIPGLGTFTFSQQKLDVGSGKYLLIQRPVFVPLEKFLQHHGLHYNRHYVPGHIPTVTLNYASLSIESPFNRDCVEACVREVLHALARAVNGKKNIELSFGAIGRLTVRDSKLKMKFYKTFVSQMDGSGKIAESMQNRPGTVDSVTSVRCSVRLGSSNTVLLPKILQTNGSDGLPPLSECEENIASNAVMTESQIDAGNVPETVMVDPIGQVAVEPEFSQNLLAADEDRFLGEMPSAYNPLQVPELMSPPVGNISTQLALENILNTHPDEGLQDLREPCTIGDEGIPRCLSVPKTGSRMALTLPLASGISLEDIPNVASRVSSHKSIDYLLNHGPGLASAAFSPSPSHSSKGPTPPSQPHFSPPGGLQNASELTRPELPKLASPVATPCGHPQAGQELCYLCHQRSRRNIPISFTEERKRRDAEEENVLQQYRMLKDAEETLLEKEKSLAKRQDRQRTQAFNQGVAEALMEKRKLRDKDFYNSFVFQHRPPTPLRFPMQQAYAKDLAQQVESKNDATQKLKQEDEMIEKLEQAHLAQDLAAQREKFFKDKMAQSENYRNALDLQTRFKSAPLPPREPDNEVFGKNDMNNEKMAERRRRAFDLFREQQEIVAQQKRETLLRRLMEQKQEEDMLDRNSRDLMEDRAHRYKIRFESRKDLEEEWREAARLKRENEHQDRLVARTAGNLVHEQCDKYRRCAQCQRRMANCGESNIWKDSYYISGSRIMV